VEREGKKTATAKATTTTTTTTFLLLYSPMKRRSFLINATDLRIVLGSTSEVSRVHREFETIWRRYHPEVFDKSYRCAKAAFVTESKSPLPVSPLSHHSSPLTSVSKVARRRTQHTQASRIAQRCVVAQPDTVQFTLYQRTMFDRLAMQCREQVCGTKLSVAVAQTMARQNGVLFEAEMLGWFYRLLWPGMRQREQQQKQQQQRKKASPSGALEAPATALSSLSDELELVCDSKACDTMYYRFMGFVRAPADGLFWWLRGKVDGKLVAQHHRFRTDASAVSPRKSLRVIEAKLHGQLYEREAELLQLLAYLLLLDVESGYLVQSKIVCGAETGNVDVSMSATQVHSDDIIWSRWIVPRMNQVLYTIDWLSRHKLAADAYFRLDEAARNAYVDHLLHSTSVLRMPSVCRMPS
jgi:hypothetical protein